MKLWPLALGLSLIILGCDNTESANYCVRVNNLNFYDKTKPVAQCDSLENEKTSLDQLDWQGYGIIISVDDGPHENWLGTSAVDCCYGVTYKKTGY